MCQIFLNDTHQTQYNVFFACFVIGDLSPTSKLIIRVMLVLKVLLALLVLLVILVLKVTKVHRVMKVQRYSFALNH